jgi:hypothetical protein
MPVSPYGRLYSSVAIVDPATSNTVSNRPFKEDALKAPTENYVVCCYSIQAKYEMPL